MIHRQPYGLAALTFGGVLAALAAATVQAAAPDFRFEIRPLLAKNCFACHGPDEAHREADLRLDVADVPIEFGAIVPGSPDESEMIRRITSDDPAERMPPPDAGRKLTADEVAKLEAWIAAGAEFARHWSYEPPQRPPLPDVEDAEWCKNEIDYFVVSRLERAGLAPEAEADRHRLIRRVSLDLTGLPPTLEEVEAFVNDERPDAYQRLVDRLLASPGYGEHWARMWLDIARFADTTGYEKDSRRTMWPYRDWVINALNADMPFDKFTVEQLAGDLLPEPTTGQIVATAFHRNTMQNDEGGTDDEEYRVAAVIDRVNTTTQAWMGTTMGCCQCHSHKYDPFAHEEYYELFAFFNQTADADRYDQEPTIPTPTPKQEKLKAELDQALAACEQELAKLEMSLAVEQRTWEEQLVADIKWRRVSIEAIESQAGATMTILDDGSVLVSGAAPDVDTYTVETRADIEQITALRLEALPHDSLPEGGPGRSEQDGGFVVSRLRVFREPVEPIQRVKYVRIELPARHDYLTLAEVQVFSGDENVAQGGKASQSSVAYEGHATLAIDGSTHPNFAKGRSISHTAFDYSPWWEVELREPTAVDRIALWNTEGHPKRLVGARLAMLDANRRELWSQILLHSPDLSAEIVTSATPMPQLRSASANSHRQGYPGRHAVENHDVSRHGWSPEPGADGPPSLVVEFDKPLAVSGGSRLRIVLDQQTKIDGRGGQTLGRFRLLATDDAGAIDRAGVPVTIRSIARVAPNERTPDEAKRIADYFRSIHPDYKELIAKREDIERRLSEERWDKLPIMKELPPAEARTTHIHERGNFLEKGAVVEPDTPEVFPPLPDDAPRNRLGLARWLVARDNPLTARVVANRHWEQLFGTGIVLTSEDFGSQGMLPTHPMLLDWLAVELMESGWSLKQLAKTIVMSAAYRQSSRTTPEKLEKDPENRLLSRGPRVRLSAEQIRDQALAVAGLLSRKIGGPSVMPPQPEGVWQVVYSDDRWITSEGEDRYRRGVYTFWRRTSPYPSAVALDAPSRETCTIRRITTNTPVAAFALLNDPVYVEAAQALARRIMEHEGDLAARAEYAFRRVVARPPTSDEVARLVKLFESELNHYAENDEAATTIATSQLGMPEGAYEMSELAAWTVVSNVLLNLDETLTK